MPLKTSPKIASKRKRAKKTGGLGIKFAPREWGALNRISKQDGRSLLAEIRWLIRDRDARLAKRG